MKRAAGAVAAIAIASTTHAASARDRCHKIDVDIYECSPDAKPNPEDEAPRLNDSGSVDVRLAFVSFAPIVADKSFTGSGTPAGGGPTTAFAATGKDLGYLHPRTYGGELDVAYLRRFIRLGGFFGISMLSPDANPMNASSADVASGGSMSMMHAGLDAAFILPLDRVRLGLGAAFGGYFLSVPLRGFELTTCTGGRYCYQKASTTIGFAQPRVSLDVALTRDDAPLTASIGGFVGMDVANEHSIAWGLTLSIHEPQQSLAP